MVSRTRVPWNPVDENSSMFGREDLPRLPPLCAATGAATLHSKSTEINVADTRIDGAHPFLDVT